MQKMFYSMSETSEIVGERESTIRYWSDNFSEFVKPERNAKGNRRFHPGDVEMLQQIKHLVSDGSLTLEGARKVLRDGKRNVDKEVKVLETLRDIRAMIQEVRDNL